MSKRRLWGMAMLALMLAVIFMVGCTAPVRGFSTGKLAGVVTDQETGEPLPGVSVIIVGTTVGASTNIRGQFFIINIPPGEYGAVVSLVGYADRKFSFTISPGEVTTRDISLTTARQRTESFPNLGGQPGASGKLAGLVTDAFTNDPIEKARIYIDGRQVATTNRHGEYFMLGVPTGSYEVMVKKSGYKNNERKNIIVSVDLTTSLDFALSKK